MDPWTYTWEAYKAHHNRAASDDQFEAWRAVVRVARQMSPSEAYRILGLEKGASPEDIRARWKVLLRQLHPDRGGSTEGMAQVNVAAETLLNQGIAQNVTLPSGAPGGGGGSWEDLRRKTEEAEARAREKWNQKREEESRQGKIPPPEPEGTSYSSAMSRGDSVEWKLVSDPGYSSNYTKDDAGILYQIRVHPRIAFGIKDGKGYIMGIVHRRHDRTVGVPSERAYTQTWDTKIFPIRGAVERAIPKALKLWMEEHTPGWRPRAKWHVLDGRMPPSPEALAKLYKGGISLKEALSGLGLMGSGGKGKSVKPAVQMSVEQKPLAEYRRLKETLKRGDDTWPLYNFELLVNGKGRTLNDREMRALKSNLVLFGLFGYAYWEFVGRRPLNLHRSRKYPVGELMARVYEALDPSPLKNAMAEAVVAYGGTLKTAYDRRTAATKGMVQRLVRAEGGGSEMIETPGVLFFGGKLGLVDTEEGARYERYKVILQPSGYSLNLWIESKGKAVAALKWAEKQPVLQRVPFTADTKNRVLTNFQSVMNVAINYGPASKETQWILAQFETGPQDRLPWWDKVPAAMQKVASYDRRAAV